LFPIDFPAQAGDQLPPEVPEEAGSSLLPFSTVVQELEMHSESRPTNDAAGRSWESRLFQYGLGLIVLGLIGLLLPTFGWQLHRLRMLGSAQWVVLVIAVTVGSGAVVWSQRRRPALGGSIAGGALAAMLLFAWLSFWRHPAEPAQVGASNPDGPTQAGGAASLDVLFEGTKTREDFELLCEFVRDCVPDATNYHAAFRESGDGRGRQITEQRLTIGPVPEVGALIREIRLGKVRLQGPNTLVVQVEFPLPPRSQAFEKRTARFLAELRSNDRGRQIQAIALLETLEPIARREEVADELLRLLQSPNPPPGVANCLKKWGTPAQVPTIIARMAGEGANLAELLDVLTAVSPDDAVRESARLLPKELAVAERTLSLLGQRAEPAVLAYADHSDRDVRQAVCRILLTIGTSRCLPPLTKLTQDADPQVSSIAQQALDVVRQRTKS
jgi:HEAT repeat protein